VSLHVESHGEGPDLVLLHGWGMHSGVWSEVLPLLAGRFRVHAFDLPGHGHSAGVPVGTLDDAADAVAAGMPRGARVCGWSLGGLVAQRVAQRHAALLSGLVLVSTTPCFVQRAGWPHAMKASVLDAFAAGLRADREATLADFVRLNALHGARGREAIRTFTARLFERGTPPQDALSATLGWLRDTDLRDAAARLPAGTLLLHGARDALVPVEAARWLAAAAPQAQLIEWPEAAHLPFFTHRESFVHALESTVA
jgi:pimeloyl-[acyl-carrier protein] methyl ester esterase